MAYDDDRDGRIFPVRTGTPQGAGTERVMLDRMQGASSFRTDVRQHLDGSTTTLRTKDGMPQFVTTDPSGTKEEPFSLYMETGQLTWTFPGIENPTAQEPATWRFTGGVSPDDLWLGAVYTGKETTDLATTAKTKLAYKVGQQLKKQPTPITEPDPHKLRDNIPSLAIGFKETDDPIKRSFTKEKYGPHVLMKKLMAGYFPPTAFSGKMRLFMQAQYGAPIKKSGFEYALEISGSSAVVFYDPPSKEDWPRYQLGFWSHYTTGLFTAPNYNYYILSLEEAAESSLMRVAILPVRISDKAKPLLRRLRNGKYTTATQQRQVEAYILSDAMIDTSKKEVVGSFDPGLCGGSVGTTLSWGWKFNWSGTKASIVRINETGDFYANTLDGLSKEITISITRTNVYDGSETGKWTVTGEASATQNWQDGWGYYNIFRPVSEVGDPTLECYSIQMGFGSVAPYNFSNIPIYGYYNAQDEWVTVKLSRSVSSGAWFGKQTKSDNLGILPSALAYESYPLPEPSGFKLWFHYTVRGAKESGWTENRVVKKQETFTVHVGGWSYAGYRELGSTSRNEVYYEGDAGEGEWAYLAAVSPYLDGSIGSIGGYVGGPTNPEQAFNDWLSDQWPYYPYEHWRKSHFGTISQRLFSGNYDEAQRWAIVIPVGDCSSVHVASQETKSYSGSAWTSESHKVPVAASIRINKIVSQSPTVTEWREFTSGPFVVDMNFYGLTTNLPWAGPASTGETSIIAWSPTLSAAPGTPATSYYSLFNVDSSYPYFNGSIGFSESAGGRYRGSEGYNSGNVIGGLFVGWY